MKKNRNVVKRKKYRYNEKKIKAEMSRMKKSVKHMLFHAKKLELDKLKDSNVSPVLIRNLKYITNITGHVQKNFNYMTSLDTKNVDNRIIIRRKFLASGIMIKHINDLIERYSYDSADFEVHNLLMNDQYMPKMFRNLSEDNLNFVMEEFKEAEKNKKVIEGFDLSAIGRFFSQIGKIFSSIIGGIVKIGKFIGGFLIKFITFTWKLMTFIFKLIFEIIPRLITNIFRFFFKLLRKTIKVGLFTMLLFVGMLMVFIKYWQIVLDVLMPPIPAVFFPALIISIHLFWNKTNDLYNAQMSLINGILWFFFGPMKNFLILILGLPKNDAFFRKKKAGIFKKIKYFIVMIAKNLAFIILRFFISILALKYLAMYGYPIVVKWLPTTKELIIFPMIVIKYIISFLQKLFYFVVT